MAASGKGQARGESDMTSSPQRTKTLTIGYDLDVELPDSMCDGWKPISFCRRHKNFEHPDLYCLNKPENIGLRRKLQVGLTFWLSYYEHNLCKWSLGGEGPQCRWDSVDIAGLLIWTGKPSNMGAKTYEDRASDARNFLEAYTDWCNGQCYWFSLEDDQQLLDSCGGFIGMDQLAEAINDALDDKDQLIAKGEAAELVRYMNLKAKIAEGAV
jgi:hypothetical protein